jgi:hypothetical protein
MLQRTPLHLGISNKRGAFSAPIIRVIVLYAALSLLADDRTRGRTKELRILVRQGGGPPDLAGALLRKPQRPIRARFDRIVAALTAEGIRAHGLTTRHVQIPEKNESA